jgi:peptidoglycan LD-endopeptidase LytH
MRKARGYFLVFLLVLFTAGLCIPQQFNMPVEGATRSSYNINSFWYYPWGKSGSHKGVDIFAKTGTNVKASVSGVIIFSGEIERGGKVVLLLGPKWRLHYYAHLNDVHVHTLDFIKGNKQIGTVGNTGNAINKPPHLHYAIVSIVPYFWRADAGREGWKKMFYLSPISFLQELPNG